MNNLVGTWKLQKNTDFGQFLGYFGFGWIKEKAALVSNIDITLTHIKDDDYVRKIHSTFMKDEEHYIIDGKPYNNEKGLTKRHKLEGNKLVSVINGKPNNLQNEIRWTETIEIDGEDMIIRRTWDDVNKTKTCHQRFVRKSN